VVIQINDHDNPMAGGGMSPEVTVVHPEYNGTTFQNDLALLKLPYAINLTSKSVNETP